MTSDEPAGRLAEGSEEEAVARDAYEELRQLDGGVSELAAEWQPAAEGGDYSPEEWKLIDRLTTIDEQAAPVLLRLGSTVPHFAGHRSRLRAALAHLEEGDRDWLSGTSCDSYLTVWRQLQSDLLITLGLE